ncbi:hypothetical protein L249_2646 [Ophiocordyceps polyrhachis-furcata BCC 54312]|uniref:Uncharacterized protein n=1 Tax=Ophiocordyceps polyrhachis-furcata BCC 54312 TaxID=1330021 RepID=A0A367LQ09_9HYPO|nr:hypothetical protein L249_2646 [Ophiocordyceps polyrhachis-furcata BCC 54312]
MNRLRGKKKNKDDAFPARPSIDTESSGPFRMFAKKKSQEEEEPKKVVDLTAALPPSDDFRTSLLMTGLSARFSMLREQDDPHSKLGKASDDSVLFPKRHSRLGDYGLAAALPDITEIESIKAPPFARVDSYVSSDDAASTNGSIMNRGKPSDGNNLFGGRQKIYKIPVGSTAKGGGMGGRALYDDDVAQSAFQRWRQAERERHSLERDRKDEPADAADPDYSRRRETSSTTSSAAARNSTAATSVASSQPASVKDWPVNQSSTTLERSVTRTRRLYEQGLSQDLHEQQSSALSRMDTLSRARQLGSRTPEPAPLVPSPTGMAFGERPQERRPIISKASAPNLRSFSPPTASSSTYTMSPPESTSKFSNKLDPKPNYGGNPPLSPPISESEDYPVLPIQPNDRGKATAMGVFQRPVQQYDESKYAQRQRQLQQGREMPSSDSNLVLGGTFRSASSSSSRRSEKTMASMEVAARKETHSTTFFDDSDDASVDNRSSIPSIPPHLTIDRPDDQDHPALRGAALPTPMSLSSLALSDETDSLADKPGELSPDQPLDSPTLGPNSGLSGLVRQHLRHDSVASSISGITDRDSMALPSSGGKPNRRREQADKVSPVSDGPRIREDGLAGNQDDFARHLADGARRVRERLTTYVETDAPSTPLNAANKDEGALRPNGLGILRSKSSRGSLRDRHDQEPGQSRLFKAQMPSSMSAGSSVSTHTSFASARDDGPGSSERLAGKESPSMNKDDSAPAGLKAFRQARRELQKMKELETRQRYQKSTGEMGHAEEGGTTHPAFLNRRPRDESANSNRSSECSRAASDSRERSGSEASTVMTSYMRGARQRNGSVTYDEYQGPYGGLGRSSPNNGLTGLAGWDIRPSTGTSMSPSQSTGAIDGTGRRSGPRGSSKAGSPNPQRHKMLHEGQPYRSAGLPSAAASTPNLHAAVAAAPPLPPINPRRKNGFGATMVRPAMEHASASHGSLSGGSEAYATAPTSEDEGFPKYRLGGRRATAGDGGRAKATSPPKLSARTMVSQVNMTRGGLPGGDCLSVA